MVRVEKPVTCTMANSVSITCVLYFSVSTFCHGFGNEMVMDEVFAFKLLQPSWVQVGVAHGDDEYQ